jgi:hypothetical protein
VTFGNWSRVKSVRHKTVLGLAIGERSLMAAEVAASDGRPIVRRVAELEYPPGVSPADAAQFSELLAAFRKEQGFTARMAVIGLPAKWIVVKQKEVPPTDAATLADLLRTGAEAEFSSELKDMAYDFVLSQESVAGKSVLLVGTPKKYIEAVEKACETSKLTPAAITSSALVLGEATGKSANPGALVLAVSAGGAELTARQNGSPSAIRYVRGPEQPAPFVSAVRRAVSTLPTGSGGREMVLWDQTGLDVSALGQQLGLKVRCGELASLGVDVAIPTLNGIVFPGRCASRCRFSSLAARAAENRSAAAMGLLRHRAGGDSSGTGNIWICLARPAAVCSGPGQEDCGWHEDQRRFCQGVCLARFICSCLASGRSALSDLPARAH